MKKKQMKKFWKIVEKDREIVSKWPLWMQMMVITAESASTGKFINKKIGIELERN